MNKIWISFVLSFGCSSLASAKTYSTAFNTSYKRVWKSTLISLSKYPLDKNDKASGELITSTIHSDEVFKPYSQKVRSNQQYKLFINVERRKINGRKAIVVKVEKKPLLKGDFLNDDKQLVSSGVEESVLLYRIAREVKIDRIVEKIFD